MRTHMGQLLRISAILAILITSLGAIATGASARSEISGPDAALIEKAEADGSALVMVRMRTFADQRAVEEQLAGLDATVSISYDAFPMLAISAGPDALEALANSSRVVSIQENGLLRPSLASSVPLINGDDVHALGFDGTNQAVAILDTGIDGDHPFFAGRIAAEACFSNAGGAGTGQGAVTLCPNGTSTQTGAGAANAETAQCLNGGTNLCAHGTHVAGIAAGATSGQVGEPGDGVAPAANIIAIQVFSRFNSVAVCGIGQAPCVLAFFSDTVLALQHVLTLSATHTIASANMSLGGGNFAVACDGDTHKPAIDALLAANGGRGIATVIASGNDGFLASVGAPGCISTAVTVGSTTDADAVSVFSNRGVLLDLFAPGSSIDSSVPDDTFANFQGTSMATPHVAGAFAALREAFPAETVAQILTRLQTNGVPITYASIPGNVTTPRIDLLAALQLGGVGDPPVITVPANITVNNDAGLGTAVVNFVVTASDTEDGDISASVVCVPPSGSAFPIGVTTVNCSVTDSDGNTDSDSFTVTVVDITPPVLILPANITVPATSPAGANVNFVVTATDNSGVAPSIVCVPPSGSLFPIATTTTVNCTATDGAGNTASGSFTVTVTAQILSIESLKAQVLAAMPPSYFRSQLVSYLDQAIFWRNRGNNQRAALHLDQFIDRVDMYSPAIIPAALAQSWIDQAELLKDGLGF